MEDVDPGVRDQKRFLEHPTPEWSSRVQCISHALSSTKVNYLGTPISVDGHNIGALCLFYKKVGRDAITLRTLYTIYSLCFTYVCASVCIQHHACIQHHSAAALI